MTQYDTRFILIIPLLMSQCLVNNNLPPIHASMYGSSQTSWQPWVYLHDKQFPCVGIFNQVEVGEAYPVYIS